MHFGVYLPNFGTETSAAIRQSLQQLEEAGATWWLQALYMERNSLEALRTAIRQGPPGGK